MDYSPPVGNFTKIQNELSTQNHFAAMGGTPAMVYLTILQNSKENNHTECTLSQRAIGKMVGTTANTVGKAIEKLEALGYIRIIKEKRQGVKEKHSYVVLQLPKIAPKKKEENRGKKAEDMVILTEAKKKKAEKVVEQRTEATQNLEVEDKLYQYYLTIYRNAGGNKRDLWNAGMFRNRAPMKLAIEQYGEERVETAYRLIHNQINNNKRLQDIGQYIFHPNNAIKHLEDYEKEQEAYKQAEINNKNMLLKMEREEERRKLEAERNKIKINEAAIEMEAAGELHKEQLEIVLTGNNPNNLDKLTIYSKIHAWNREKAAAQLQHAAD